MVNEILGEGMRKEKKRLPIDFYWFFAYTLPFFKAAFTVRTFFVFVYRESLKDRMCTSVNISGLCGLQFSRD